MPLPLRKALRIALPALLLGVLLWGFHLSDIDIALQDRIYDLGGRAWPLAKSYHALRLIFYDGPKFALVALAVGLFGALIWSFRNRSLARFRRRIAFVLVMLALVPATVALGKAVTNVSCPLALDRYGGTEPYVRLLDRAPEGARRGRCFPAGHASGGFALIALFFALNHRGWRIAGLASGMGMGWLMGGYQMLIGAHFLSHTVATMLLAWFLCVLIQPLVLRKNPPTAALAVNHFCPQHPSAGPTENSDWPPDTRKSPP